MREIYEKIIVVKRLITADTGKWCVLPYPGHPKGCPNYGNADRCPPLVPQVEKVFDVEKPLYLVYSEFNLAEHADRMREKHPGWTERQTKCVLYWQNTARKRLKERVAEATLVLGTNICTYCPEGMGVNVFATARKSGLFLEKTKNIKVCRHVAMLGYKGKGL